MREILFRGKRVDNGEWVEGFLFDDGLVESHRFFVGGIVIEDYKGTACDKYSITGSDYEEVIPKTVGQYIGQNDTNSQRIFEGDIVEFDDGSGWFEEEPGLGVIVWDEERVGFAISGEHRIYGLDEVGGDVKVVGNIFDNPNAADW